MKCPGQDMQYWNADAIFEVKCPECKKPVEFYKDDTNRRCHHCGHRFVNPKMDFGCAAYCQYAEQCLGTLPEEFAGAQEALLKDKVAVEVKRHFKNDFHRIGHATRVARYAETLGKSAGANVAVLLCGAYLHDIGKTSTGESVDSTSEIATDILTRLKTKEPMLEAVCAILEKRNTKENDLTLERQLLADAANLALLEEACKNKENESIEQLAGNIKLELTSEEAHEIAEKLLADALV